MSRAAALPAPVVATALAEARARLPAVDPLTALLALAMMEATLAGVDLRTTAECLESVRAEVKRADPLCATADALTALAAALPDGSPLAIVLIRLRDRWTTGAVAASIADIRAALADDSVAGQGAWHAALAAALAATRFDIVAAIAAADLPLPADLAPSPAELAHWARLVEDGRWREGERLFAYFGSDATRDMLARARALTIVAEIEAVIRLNPAAAEAAITRAEELAPRDWRCRFVRARMAEDQQIGQAEEEADRAAGIAPEEAEIQAALARLRLKQGDVEGAEAFVLKAARCANGQADGLLAQIEIYANAALFARHADRLPALVDRVTLLGRQPAYGYDAMVRAGDAHEANGGIDAALGWYARAEAYQPDRIQAMVSRGYLHLRRLQYEDAAAAFAQVIHIAPEAVDGHWGLANIAEETRDWPGLILWGERSIARAPEWRPAIISRLRRLAEDPLDFANADLAVMRSFYDDVRRLAGETFAPTYHNLLGNIAFYGGDHALAAQEYRSAIATAEAPDARYHGNLALALEAIDAANPDSDEALVAAIEAARRAQALTPEEPDYADYLRRFEATRLYVTLYGTAARALLPDKARLRILLEPEVTGVISVDDGAGSRRLSHDFASRIMSLRAAVLVETGFTLCGVTVTDAPDQAHLPGWWAIEVGGVRVESARAPAAVTAGDLLDLIEAGVRRHLPALLGLPEAAELAAKMEGADGLVDAPWALAAFARNARAILTETDRIDPAADADRLMRDTALPAPVSADRADRPIVERIEIVTGPDRDDFASHSSNVQAIVHQALGVVIPLPVQRIDSAPGAPDWRVETAPAVSLPDADRALPADEAVAGMLQGIADQLLTETALRWQLQHVRQSAPQIVGLIEQAMDEARLLERLRLMVRSGRSIRNLAQALQDVLLKA